MCLFSLTIFNYASVDNCCGIPWAAVVISLPRMTGSCPLTSGPSTEHGANKRRCSTGRVSSWVGMPAPSRTLMQTLLPVASYWVPPSPPLVHLNLPSQYQVKKHDWWPLSTDGVAAHAYSPVEGMVSWWVGDANCLNRRCHLIWRWLLLVVTRSLSDFWCSNDLRALRSVGCPAPPSGCLRDLFSLVLSLRTVTPPENRPDKRFCAMRRRRNTWRDSPRIPRLGLKPLGSSSHSGSNNH